MNKLIEQAALNPETARAVAHELIVYRYWELGVTALILAGIILLFAFIFRNGI